MTEKDITRLIEKAARLLADAQGASSEAKRLTEVAMRKISEATNTLRTMVDGLREGHPCAEPRKAVE